MVFFKPALPFAPTMSAGVLGGVCRRPFTSLVAKTAFPVGVDHAVDLVRRARQQQEQERRQPLQQQEEQQQQRQTSRGGGGGSGGGGGARQQARLLGLDVGTSRVGVAVTDATFTFAVPLGAIDRVTPIRQQQRSSGTSSSSSSSTGIRASRARGLPQRWPERHGAAAVGRFAAQLGAVARRHGCCGCVVGWPLELSGREGRMCREVLLFLHALRPHFAGTGVILGGSSSSSRRNEENEKEEEEAGTQQEQEQQQQQQQQQWQMQQGQQQQEQWQQSRSM